MINYKLRLFTSCSSYGVEEMRPKSQLCACSFPDTNEYQTFEYAACGRENFRIRKQKLRKKKIPDTCGHGFSVHTCSPYTLGISGDFCMRSADWKFLYTLCIRIRVDARIRIFFNTLTSQYQNQSFSARDFPKWRQVCSAFFVMRMLC